jgi:hypothetical protein
MDEEKQMLLASSAKARDQKYFESSAFLHIYRDKRVERQNGRGRFRTVASWTAVYLGGVLTVLLAQWLLPYLCDFYPIRLHFSAKQQEGPFYSVASPSFPGDVGSTVVHDYPPASPTNAFPSMFPTEVGYPGPTATGAEPGLVLTAGTYPFWKGTDGLVKPDTWKGKKHGGKIGSNHEDHGDEDSIRELPSWIEDDSTSDQSKKSKHKSKFNVLHHWGNLTPFHSVPPDSFGIKSSTGAEVPPTCSLKGAHILHRHGARYPTGWCKSYSDSLRPLLVTNTSFSRICSPWFTSIQTSCSQYEWKPHGIWRPIIPQHLDVQTGYRGSYPIRQAATVRSRC